MSFSIDIQPLSSFKRIRITNLISKVYIDIISKGGILNSWMQPAENWDIIDGNDFSSGWSNFESNGFKSAKMSPYACRLFNGIYEHENKSFKVEKFYLGNHGLHGILYDAEFEIIETNINNQTAQVKLEFQYHGTDKGFPFEYNTQLTWTYFSDNTISIQTTITNNSNQPIPMMDGWHPYFSFGETINDAFITLKAKGKIQYDEGLLPTGKILDENEFESSRKIESLHLDNCYLVDATANTCILENEDYQLIVQPILNYPYLQLYTPSDRKSIAIENLTGIPNCFNNKIFLR
jgi:aldose 1-epimerase